MDRRSRHATRISGTVADDRGRVGAAALVASNARAWSTHSVASVELQPRSRPARPPHGAVCRSALTAVALGHSVEPIPRRSRNQPIAGSRSPSSAASALDNTADARKAEKARRGRVVACRGGDQVITASSRATITPEVTSTARKRPRSARGDRRRREGRQMRRIDAVAERVPRERSSEILRREAHSGSARRAGTRCRRAGERRDQQAVARSGDMTRATSRRLDADHGRSRTTSISDRAAGDARGRPASDSPPHDRTPELGSSTEGDVERIERATRAALERDERDPTVSASRRSKDGSSSGRAGGGHAPIATAR